MVNTLDFQAHQPRILIVDDERHNRQLLEVILKSEGFLPDTAANGAEALAMVARQPPDLILLDIMMPGMDGYEVATALKANLATRNIPVIMVTALDDRKARMLGLMAGAEDFLSKPVDRAELCMRVRNLSRLKVDGDDKQSQAALLDLAQDAIVVRDMQGLILFWNRGAEAMFGWSSDDAHGQSASELLRSECDSRKEDITSALLQSDRWEGEITHYARDGSRVIVSSRMALQRDANGEPVRILTISNDITARKANEAQLRVAELALEQLRHDQLQFKDDFLSHVSHELRSPLTAIKQFTTILLGETAGSLNTTQREYQQIVLKNIRQLQSMIDDLLEVTRLETGKLTVNLESVPVKSAVTDSLNTLRGTALAKHVALSVDVPLELPPVYADETRLRQILIILLDNAIKFTPNRGHVTIRVRSEPEDNKFVRIEVSDTGCGMSADIGGRIFERLYQASNQLDTSRKGLGLGLYICKELVTKQGGTICAKRRKHVGTTISFTLPTFSLDHLIAPLYREGKWPAMPLAIVVAQSSTEGGWSSTESRDEWCHEARALLHHCLMPDLDVLLPTVRTGNSVEQFFVAVFADDAGTSVLAKRIQGQFDRLLSLKQTKMTLSVSHRMLQPFAPPSNASVGSVVSQMAGHLQEAVNANILSQDVSS